MNTIPSALNIYNKKNKKFETLHREVKEDLYKKFLFFIKRSELLRNTDFIKEFTIHEWIITRKGNVIINAETTNPLDMKNFHEIIHLLRPIILEREKGYFFYITKQLKRLFKHPGVDEYINNKMDIFRGKIVRDIYPQKMDLNKHPEKNIVIQDPYIVSEESLKNYLYSQEYHFHDDNKEAYNILLEYIPEDLALSIFAYILHEKVFATIYVSTLINNMFGINNAPAIEWSGISNT